MKDADKPQGFWQTLPGLLTAIAAMITAVTGLLVAVYHPKPEPARDATPVARAREGASLRAEGIARAKIDPAPVDLPHASPANVGASLATGYAPPVQSHTLGPSSTANSAVTNVEVPSASANVVITTNDGPLVVVRGDSLEICSQKELTLTYGQSIPFEKIWSIDLASSSVDALATRVLLTDGRTIDGKVFTYCMVDGRNDDGPFQSLVTAIKRLEFRR